MRNLMDLKTRGARIRAASVAFVRARQNPQRPPNSPQDRAEVRVEAGAGAIAEGVPVRLIEVFGQQRRCLGWLVDLSPSAMRIRVASYVDGCTIENPNLQIGRWYQLSFALPGLSPITGTGLVMRFNQNPHGLEIVLSFQNLQPEARDAIERLCAA